MARLTFRAGSSGEPWECERIANKKCDEKTSKSDCSYHELILFIVTADVPRCLEYSNVSFAAQQFRDASAVSRIRARDSESTPGVDLSSRGPDWGQGRSEDILFPAAHDYPW
jgi:hypothetical protein